MRRVLCLAALLSALPAPALALPTVIGEPRAVEPDEPSGGQQKQVEQVLKIAGRWLTNRDYAHEVFAPHQIRVDLPDLPPLWVEVEVLVSAVDREAYRAEWFPAVGRVLELAIEQWPALHAAVAGLTLEEHAPNLWIQLRKTPLQGPAAPASQRIAPKLHALLMLDTAAGPTFVRASHLAAWGQTVEALMPRAIQQTAKQAGMSRTAGHAKSGYDRWSGASWKSDAAMVGFAPALAEGEPCGVVVGTTSSVGFGAVPMRSADSLRAIGRIVDDLLQSSGVAWLTRNVEVVVYWVRGGEWAALPITVNDVRALLHPPPALLECLGDG